MNFRLGWKSLHITEQIHRWLEFSGIIALFFVVIFDLFAWRYLKAHHWLEFASIIALALLVVVEVVAWCYGNHANMLQAQKDKHNQDELDRLNEIAATADINLKSTQENLARESKISTDLKTEITRINYQHSQRLLTATARKNMVDNLSKYPGQKFEVIFYDGDREAFGLADNIAHAFINCGWIRDDSRPTYKGLLTPKNIVITGVVAMINPEDGENGPPAMADLGKCIEIGVLQKNDCVVRGTIVIYVMPKAPAKDQMMELFNKNRERSQKWQYLLFPQNIVAHLSAYQGQTFNLYSPWYDETAEALSSMICVCLTTAQWKMTNEWPAYLAYPTDFTNVRIGISDEDSKQESVPPAAFALIEAFKKHGVIDQADSLHIFQGMPKGEIEIRVGIGPEPIKLKSD